MLLALRTHPRFLRDLRAASTSVCRAAFAGCRLGDRPRQPRADDREPGVPTARWWCAAASSWPSWTPRPPNGSCREADRRPRALPDARALRHACAPAHADAGLLDLQLAAGVTTVFNMGLADGGARSTTRLAGRRGGRALERPTLPGQRAAAGERQPEVLGRRAAGAARRRQAALRRHQDPRRSARRSYDALITGARAWGIRVRGHAQHFMPWPRRSGWAASSTSRSCSIRRWMRSLPRPPLRAGGRRKHRSLPDPYTNLTAAGRQLPRPRGPGGGRVRRGLGPHIGHLPRCCPPTWTTSGSATWPKTRD